MNCPICGLPLAPSPRGRPRKYHPTCAAIAHRLHWQARNERRRLQRLAARQEAENKEQPS